MSLGYLGGSASHDDVWPCGTRCPSRLVECANVHHHHCRHAAHGTRRRVGERNVGETARGRDERQDVGRVLLVDDTTVAWWSRTSMLCMSGGSDGDLAARQRFPFRWSTFRLKAAGNCRAYVRRGSRRSGEKFSPASRSLRSTHSRCAASCTTGSAASLATCGADRQLLAPMLRLLCAQHSTSCFSHAAGLRASLRACGAEGGRGPPL